MESLLVQPAEVQRSDSRDPSAQNERGVVFITGASRSGTTLLSRMLGLHSRITSTNELHVFGDLVAGPDETIEDRSKQASILARIESRERDGIWHERSSPEYLELAEQLLDHAEEKPVTAGDLFQLWVDNTLEERGGDFLCEHTPRNVFFIRRLLETNANVRIVHVVRDPRAVMASQKFRSRRGKLDKVRIPLRERLRVWASYHPVTTSRLWIKATTTALKFKSDPRVLIVRYEDVVLDGPAVMAKTLGLLDLEYETSTMNVVAAGSSHQSTDDTDTGLSTKSLRRWIDVLNPAEVEVCERLCHPLMSKLGYQSNQSGKVTWGARSMQQLTLPLKLALVAVIDPVRVRIQLQSMFGSRGKHNG